MKLSFCTAATLFLFFGLGGANLLAGPMQGPAIKYSIYDRDPDDGNGPIRFLSSGQSYSSDFNLLEKGYNPLTMQITAARITFAFADDGDSDKGKNASPEYATVYLGGKTWLNAQEVDGNHQNAPDNYDYYYQEWSISNPADVAFLNSLASGILTYKVKSVQGGDFYLKIAQLEIQTSSIVKAAEGGSTALLMVFSIAGMVWHCFRRKRDAIVP